MLALVGKYSSDFPEHTPSAVLSKKKCGGDVVLITGSTGSIGASTLAELLESPKVEKVYAFNRLRKEGPPLIARQKLSLISQGLKEDLVLSEKLVMLEGDLGRPCLGLEESIQREARNGSHHHLRPHADPYVFFSQVRDSLTHIMHIGTPRRLSSRPSLPLSFSWPAERLPSFLCSLEGRFQPDTALLRNLHRGPPSADRLRPQLSAARTSAVPVRQFYSGRLTAGVSATRT